eukprot:TRINITY_DN7896_c0_g1_i1.p1 TRINITY_DN7896_c0_g1~~TRINITY_DN7896_c0_g1_i1.p1  ORF type:complete len:177 (+),score=17.86 TRINITY_DN7896_c0_g1_i1:101-631(+)
MAFRRSSAYTTFAPAHRRHHMASRPSGEWRTTASTTTTAAFPLHRAFTGGAVVVAAGLGVWNSTRHEVSALSRCNLTEKDNGCETDDIRDHNIKHNNHDNEYNAARFGDVWASKRSVSSSDLRLTDREMESKEELDLAIHQHLASSAVRHNCTNKASTDKDAQTDWMMVYSYASCH